ncbi:hypothetical protein [Sulfuriroseicoccus oceanibius]|uniref:Uncharacterized protein n=1 Tax=Sulfuriroseicoccus oceanibius TaxID=2707525 RepID=A0A6B3LAI8_9BACT|nr:hypothetical protein [Sulfuriroseicoccus oceanibius]QQL46231.1 hypothetical protein G3M56_006515 [Sulfuriroseicoccus oceanibius]
MSKSADNPEVTTEITITGNLTHKAFHAVAKNGYRFVAVLPMKLADQAETVTPGSRWIAQFSPFDFSSARLVEKVADAAE